MSKQPALNPVEATLCDLREPTNAGAGLQLVLAQG